VIAARDRNAAAYRSDDRETRVRSQCGWAARFAGSRRSSDATAGAGLVTDRHACCEPETLALEPAGGQPELVLRPR
jgi:hypothetical protein